MKVRMYLVEKKSIGMYSKATKHYTAPVCNTRSYLVESGVCTSPVTIPVPGGNEDVQYDDWDL